MNTVESINLVSESHYDGMGRQDWVKAPAAWAFDLTANQYTLVAAKTSYEYDALGRVTKTTFEGGTYTETGYDSLGRKAWARDQLGRQTDYTYDDTGRLTSVTLPAVRNDATGQMERPSYVYRYDAYGNMVEQEDAEGRVTTFTYDAFNRRVTRTLPGALDADGGTLPTATETTTHDQFGRVKSVTDFAGTVTWNVYDSLGRLSSVLYFASGVTPSDAGTGANDRIVYAYDALGRQSQITARKDVDADGIIEPADGDYERVTTQEFDAGNRLTEVASPEGTIRYAFNDLGQKTDTWTSTEDKQQATTWTHYSYDQIGRLLNVIARRISGQDVSFTTSYAYAATGQLTHQVDANGVTSDWAFDKLGRLVQLAHKNSAGALATFRYTLNAVGQRTHVEESGPAVFGGSRTIDYEYDAIDRLTKETVQGGSTTEYYFDLVGNRLRLVKDSVTSSYTYNDRDELLTETTGGVTIKSYYDDNGSLAQTKQGQTVTAEYEYDLRKKMIQAAVNGVTIKYTYDHDGLQVRRTIGSDTDAYLQDKQNPTGYSQVLEHWRNGALYRSFVLGQSILAQADGSTVRWLLGDGHGDTRALLDAAGHPITGQLLAYDTYGKVISGQTSILTPIQYAAQWIDDATGLSFNRARWYDLAGRWTQKDAFEGVALVPNTLHGMLYAWANPIAYLDSSGASPNQYQATTAAVIVQMVRNLEAKLPLANQDQILWEMHNIPFDDGVTKDYVYTTQKGWIDCQHFFNCAAYTRKVGAAIGSYTAASYIVDTFGVGNEIIQFVGGNLGDALSYVISEGQWRPFAGRASSAFTSEDFPSNSSGSNFAEFLIAGPGPKLSMQLDSYFSAMGATNPTAAPDWTSLASDELEHEEDFRDTRIMVLTGVLTAGLLTMVGIAVLNRAG